MVNPSVSDYYTYDARDRVANSTEVVGSAKYSNLYQYDKASNVVQITYPDGYVLSMTYDGVNRLKTAGGFATLSYTLDDRISKITYGNGEVQTYTYDTRDRPTRILDASGGTHEMDLNYTYDGTGNVLTLNTESYGYDWLNRLVSASGPWVTITYSYDQVGNRVKMVQGSATTYAYGAFNRLSSAGSTTYTYDANGNMVTKNDGTTWTYTYDYQNRLIKVVHSGTTVQQNYYDGGGNRVQQVAGSSTFTYSYMGLNILYDKNVTGSTTTITKHFYADGLQVAKMVGTGVYYLHQDALGSTRLVVTSTLTVKFSSNYVPYGQNYAISGKEVFMYTGKPYDPSTGLYYYGARYYDPSIGRFVTEDSYPGSREDPQTLNRYSYARDNPMKFGDPTGHVVVSMVAGGSTGGTTSTSACTAAGDYCLSTTGSYGGSLATCTASADVCLGRMGVEQAVTSTALPQLAQQTSSCLANLCGAAAVAGGALAVTLTVAATGAIASFGAILGLGLLAIGTGFAIGYVIKNGYSSTPGGALNAFITGVTLPFHLSNPLGSLGSPQGPPGPLPSPGPGPLGWLFGWL